MSEQERPDSEPMASDAKAPLSPGDKSAIVSAIHNLDKKSPDHFTKEGHPRVDVLTEMVGFKVTRSDVVEVWGETQEGDAAGPTSQEEATDLRDDPIACLEQFEIAMQGSRNAILHQFYKAWLRDKPQAIELAGRLKIRGQY